MTTYTPSPASIIAGSTDPEGDTPTLYSIALEGEVQDVIANPGDYPYTLATGLSGIDIVIADNTGAFVIDDNGNPAAFPSTRGGTAEVVVEYFTVDSDTNVSTAAGVRTITLAANILPVYTPGSANVSEGATVNIDLASALDDADGQTLSLSGVTATSGTINSVTGLVINYTAPAYATAAVDVITFDVLDGIETVADQEFDITVLEVSGVNVGATATTNGTALFSGIVHGAADQTSMTFWFIGSRPTATGLNCKVVGFDTRQNLLQSRSGFGWRAHADDGTDTNYCPLGASDGYSEGANEMCVAIASYQPNGTGGTLIGVAGKAFEDAWAASSLDATLVGSMNISAGNLRLFGDGYVGSIVRAGVAIGVALDVTSATVRNALWDSGSNVPIVDATTFQALLTGGTILVDIYGGASVFNGEDNPGGTLDLTGRKTGTFT